MKRTLFNLVSFKAGWLAVVLLAAAGRPVAGSVAALCVIALHLAQSPDRRRELLLIAASAAVGLLWESLLVAANVLEYRAGVVFDGVAPFWIVVMWMLFATTLNVGMRWLRRSTLLAVAAGLIGGPMAFFAGQSFGAVTFADPVYSPMIIGLGWALLLPLMVGIAGRFDGFVTVHEPSRV